MVEQGETPLVPEAVYSKMPVDDLVLYAAKRVLDSGEECTFERLVYECFTLFPKQFSLTGYSEWPNSERINKSWLRCRTDKGWLAGSVKEGFHITPKGERIAAQVEKKLNLPPLTKVRQATRAAGRYKAVVRELRRSELFRRYQSDPNKFNADERELRPLLGGTLETPIPILRQNLHFYLDAAQQHEDQEVVAFLEACRKAASSLFKQACRR